MAVNHLVARVGKPHGLRGEVTVQTYTDSPQRRFVPGATFGTEPSRAVPLRITTARVHQRVYLLGFEGFDDRTAAETLRGTRLLAAVGDGSDLDADVADNDDDEEEGWYEEELLGLPVTLLDGTVLGEVSALHTRDVQDLLAVRLVGGRQVLVPFVEQIVTKVVLATDDEGAASARVVLDPPAGLLDLDAPRE